MKMWTAAYKKYFLLKEEFTYITENLKQSSWPLRNSSN